MKRSAPEPVELCDISGSVKILDSLKSSSSQKSALLDLIVAECAIEIYSVFSGHSFLQSKIDNKEDLSSKLKVLWFDAQHPPEDEESLYDLPLLQFSIPQKIVEVQSLCVQNAGRKGGSSLAAFRSGPACSGLRPS